MSKSAISVRFRQQGLKPVQSVYAFSCCAPLPSYCDSYWRTCSTTARVRDRSVSDHRVGLKAKVIHEDRQSLRLSWYSARTRVPCRAINPRIYARRVRRGYNRRTNCSADWIGIVTRRVQVLIDREY
jgi:hypothetical protein